MNIKATLICDDVRVEASGALTLVGVYNERLVVPAGDGPIQIPPLAFVVIVAGLAGTERVDYRQYVHRVDDPEAAQPEPRSEPHHPDADEHTFVFGSAPIIAPGPATYELVVELDALEQSLVHRYRFHVARDA